MAQRTKRIALDRSYLPIDPNTLLENLHDTGGEDRPEDRVPIIPFEGWNFMPTGYGWRSYFGIGSRLDIDALELPARCRELFVYQKTDLSNFLVALCDTGIWTKQGESAGAWTQAVTLTDPDDGTLLEWSYAILENALYVYRQGAAAAYKCAAPGFAFATHTPNTLNMAGQLGIYKAGTRLGFWDSSDAIAFSSHSDLTDFVPSVSTLANITTLKEKIGKIITVVQHGDGFIVYATKSIIGVVKDLSNTFLWRTTVISNVAGIAYRKNVTIGSPDSEHYAWTSIGLMRIKDFKAEIIAPELYDFLKESQTPIYLKMLEGRYLALQLADDSYVDGIISFYTETVEGETITLAEAHTIWDSMPDPLVITSLEDGDARLVYSAFNLQPDQIAVESESGGCGGIGLCVGEDYPVYQDKFVCPITPVAQLLEITKSGLQANFDSAPFTLNGKTKNLGTIAQPIGSLETQLNNVPVVDKDYTGNVIITSDNERNFFDKITAIWNAYNLHLEGYVAKLKQQLADLSPKLLSTDTTQHISMLEEVFETPLVPVMLGRVGAGVGDEVAAATVYPTATTPITIAGVTVNEYLGRLPYRYELEYGKVGYTYYGIAKPTREVEYSGELSRQTASYVGPFRITVTGRTGSGVAIANGAFVENSTSGDVFTDIDNALTLAGLTITGIASVGGSQLIVFPQNGALTSQSGFSGLTMFDHTGSPWSVVEAGQTLTYNVQDGGAVPGTVSIAMTCHGMRAFDQMTHAFVDQANSDAYCAREQYISYSHPTSFVQYNIAGEASASPNTPPVYDEQDVLDDSLCGRSLEARPRPTIFGMSVSAIPTLFPRIEVIINEIPFIVQQTQTITFTYPPVSFLMQAGTAAPYEVLWKGAYVYDTHLKRWGKMKQDYYQLLDFSPINSTALGTIPYTNFSIQGAMLDADGIMRVFDHLPSDSYLKFGKYGNFRQGFTKLETVRADFRQPCSGQLEIESSHDGRSVDSASTITYDYNNVSRILQGHGKAARWHNIGFKGQFDLSYLELTSWSSSRR